MEDDMPYSMITSKGQITIPKAVRNRLNLKTGDRLDFRIEEGQLRLIPVNVSVDRVFGALSRKKAWSVTVERMNAGIKKAIREKNT